jgi:hypothetical protein
VIFDPLAAGYAERFVWKVLHFVKKGTNNGCFQTHFFDPPPAAGYAGVYIYIYIYTDIYIYIYI